jgi:transposase
MQSENDDLFKKLQEEELKQKTFALNALENFISNYEPADKKTVEIFYTTAEIVHAIAEHTGVYLQKTDVYEMLTNMGYKFEAKNGLEFNWLLKKD